MKSHSCSIYDGPVGESASLRPFTAEDLRDIDSAWSQILTREPVFSAGAGRHNYLITFDEDTESYLEECEADSRFVIESETSETAIYDFLREMPEEYWSILDEGCMLWSLPMEKDSSENLRLYEFSDHSEELSGSFEFDGIPVECAHDPCPNSGFPRMMYVIRTDVESDEPVCFICDLMPKQIADECIRRNLETSYRTEPSGDCKEDTI